jgi:serine/threonine protein kinase
MASATAAAAAAMAAVDQANLPPEEADAARKAVQRQLQREREWLARQKLKGYVAQPEFDGRATTDFYGFGKVLGQGSFGEVRLAWHRLAGQKVAIKSYEKSKMTEPNHWRRVQQEIRIL